ncbi:hypothetical protein [Quadrisphaera setariae]|uniref:hypothetical protein n=1 Tax=Quadrisphaera setariae TaxID=2593304 RepID=UPI00164FEAAA|nr:hypothetical protein [Quadrisphaera setariae]
MIIWTGSWFSRHQPWVARGTFAAALAALVLLVRWAQGLPADPWVFVVVLVGASVARAVRDGMRWRRWRETQRVEGFTDEQVLSGERVLRRGVEPTSAAEREAALHLAAFCSRDLGSPMAERWAFGFLAVVLVVLAAVDSARWLVVLALLVLMMAVSRANRRRLDRRCGELLAQVAVRP